MNDLQRLIEYFGSQGYYVFTRYNPDRGFQKWSVMVGVTDRIDTDDPCGALRMFATKNLIPLPSDLATT